MHGVDIFQLHGYIKQLVKIFPQVENRFARYVFSARGPIPDNLWLRTLDSFFSSLDQALSFSL